MGQDEHHTTSTTIPHEYPKEGPRSTLEAECPLTDLIPHRIRLNSADGATASLVHWSRSLLQICARLRAKTTYTHALHRCILYPEGYLGEHSNYKHLDIAHEASEDTLLIRNAQPPIVHRFRYPQ